MAPHDVAWQSILSLHSQLHPCKHCGAELRLHPVLQARDMAHAENHRPGQGAGGCNGSNYIPRMQWALHDGMHVQDMLMTISKTAASQLSTVSDKEASFSSAAHLCGIEPACTPAAQRQQQDNTVDHPARLGRCAEPCGPARESCSGHILAAGCTTSSDWTSTCQQSELGRSDPAATCAGGTAPTADAGRACTVSQAGPGFWHCRHAQLGCISGL